VTIAYHRRRGDETGTEPSNPSWSGATAGGLSAPCGSVCALVPRSALWSDGTPTVALSAPERPCPAGLELDPSRTALGCGRRAAVSRAGSVCPGPEVPAASSGLQRDGAECPREARSEP